MAQKRCEISMIKFLIILFLNLNFVFAIGSSNYNITNPTISDVAGNISSTNYKINTILEAISGAMNSGNYTTSLGFFQGYSSDNPNINLISPLNATTLNSLNAYFAANFSDGNGLKNATLYIWNSSKVIVNKSEMQNITGGTNSSNISVILPYEGTFEWNYYVCDITGTCVFNESNRSLIISIPSTPSSSVSGGGGGGITTEKKEEVKEPSEIFTISESQFNIRIIFEEVKTREFKIKNLENKSISINIDVESINDLIIIDNPIILEPFEEKLVKFEITGPKEKGIKTGKILLNYEKIKKEILIIVNPQSKETLFDLFVDLIDSKIAKGEVLKTKVDLLPVGEKGVDVTIKYIIRNFKGKIYEEKSETLYINKQTTLTKEFNTNKLIYGDYVLGVEISYLGGFASASSSFKIEEEPVIFLFNRKILILIIVVIILAVLIIIELINIRKTKNIKDRVGSKFKSKRGKNEN